MTVAMAATYYTLREMMRRKLLLVFAAGGLLLAIGLGAFIALAPTELLQGNSRPIFIVLFAGQVAEFFLFLTALGIGATTIYNDLDSGSVVSIFTKPISRLEYTLGKVGAALAAMAGVALVLGLGLLVTLELAGGGHESLLLLDFGRILANEATILLIVLALTAVTNNIVAIVVGVVLTNVANIVNTFWLFTKDLPIAVGWKVLLGTLHWVLPRQLRYSVGSELAQPRGGFSGVSSQFFTSDWTDIAYWVAYLVLLGVVLYLLVKRKQV
jgi:ABC-type transport system involved in multi-copper enzyme maturation permease subunit